MRRALAKITMRITLYYKAAELWSWEGLTINFFQKTKAKDRWLFIRSRQNNWVYLYVWTIGFAFGTAKNLMLPVFCVDNYQNLVLFRNVLYIYERPKRTVIYDFIVEALFSGGLAGA